MPNSFYFDDDGDGSDDWAFSIVVYIPSVGVEATHLRTQMNDALRGKQTPASKPTPSNVKKTGELPSARTSDDDDL